MLRSGEELDLVPPDFGVDFGGPLPEEDVGTVDVPETVSPLDDQELQQFLSVANSLSQLSCDDIQVNTSHYLCCKELLHNMLSNVLGE